MGGLFSEHPVSRHSEARPKAASPESITLGSWFWIPARRFAAPRNDA
jgi:hypothetical protein